MSCIKTFVTEYTADLVYSLQTAYDQTLQIKLKGNTQLQIFVQSIEMGLKWSCSSAACICNQHRSLYFHEAFAT